MFVEWVLTVCSCMHEDVIHGNGLTPFCWLASLQIFWKEMCLTPWHTVWFGDKLWLQSASLSLKICPTVVVYFLLTCSVEVMYSDAVLVAGDGCMTFVPLHESHPPPSLPRIFLCHVTTWLGVCDFISEVGTCGLEPICLVQGQPLCPKIRVKCDWRRMDTSPAVGRHRCRHMSCSSCAVTSSRHHISQRLCGAACQPTCHIQYMRWVGLGCLFLFALLQECCWSALLIKNRWPVGRTAAPSCYPTYKRTYTRIYWLLVFRLLPSLRAVLFVNLLNYQWGIGSRTERWVNNTWISHVSVYRF